MSERLESVNQMLSAAKENAEATAAELRALNTELETKNNRLELSWEAIRGGVFEHRIPIDGSTYVSEQWAQVLGYRVEDLPQGEQLLHWLAAQAHPEDRERWERTYNNVIEGKANRYSIELRFRHVGGQWIWVRKIARVIDRDEQGRPNHLLRMMIDITDLKQVEASLKDSVIHLRDVEERLVEADRQKDEFLAMLGHELRNPLAAIRTASELLKFETEKSPNIVHAQQVLDRQTAHMSKLLDGLLDISRIIRGKIRLELETLDFVTICREVAEDIAESMGIRRIEISTRLPAEPVWVLADRVRLAQIVDNLLSNAVKYTPDAGSISLMLEIEEERAVLTIQDTGIGIEAELLPHVFEVFRQSTQSIDRSHGGLGLGLALVKTLTDLHEGTVKAESGGLGLGAKFTFALPLCAAPRTTVTPSAVEHGRPLRVLIIEDNEDAAEMLQQLLQLSGHDAAVAHSGKDGTALARSFEPHVILCDLGLPGMSGYDVAQEIRREDNTKKIYMIAVSGYGRPEDKAQAILSGFDAHMTKPVDLKALERVFAEQVARLISGAPK